MTEQFDMTALAHSGHDYDLLRARWEDLAAATGCRCSVLSEEGGHPVLVVENEAAAEGKGGGVYLSAGVHGDECAPVWGLLHWAEASLNAGGGSDRPLVIFPCLNPTGLVDNSRRDRAGVDLNRRFQDAAHPLIGRWQSFLERRCFDFALNLHEDYDARGVYLYELHRGASHGERLLAACESIIPRETAETVDGSAFERGLMSRSDGVERIVEEELDGWPEAIYLYVHHAAVAHTFETPSEMDLSRRVEAHRRFVEAALG